MQVGLKLQNIKQISKESGDSAQSPFQKLDFDKSS